MTPKEKAQQLVNNFLESLYDNGSLSFKRILYPKAKKCALIAVDEILEANSNINVFIASKEVKFKNKAETEVKSDCKENFEYWQEVKQEIEKL